MVWPLRHRYPKALLFIYTPRRIRDGVTGISYVSSCAASSHVNDELAGQELLLCKLAPVSGISTAPPVRGTHQTCSTHTAMSVSLS